MRTMQKWLADTVAAYYSTSRSQRFGQYLMNQLGKERADLMADVMDRNPPIDPFYDDTKIEAFLEYLERNWNNQPS